MAAQGGQLVLEPATRWLLTEEGDCTPCAVPNTDERWWDAWRAFRRIGDCAAALTQQAVVLCPNDPTLQGEVARWSVLW